MSVGRRGSDRNDLQYKSVKDTIRWQSIGSSGKTQNEASNPPEPDLIQAPPGVKWRVYAIDYHWEAHARNPAEQPENTPQIFWALSFSQQLVEGAVSGSDLTENGTYENDEHLLWKAHDWIQNWGGASTNPGGAGQQTAVGGAIWRPMGRDSIELDDRDELGLVAYATYPANNTLSGGEQEIFLNFSATLHYEPIIENEAVIDTS